MIVAIARKLLIELWRFVTTGETTTCVRGRDAPSLKLGEK